MVAEEVVQLSGNEDYLKIKNRIYMEKRKELRGENLDSCLKLKTATSGIVEIELFHVCVRKDPITGSI